RVHVVDLNSRALLRIGHGGVNALDRGVEDDNLTFAHAFRSGPANADDEDIAVLEHLAHDRTDFRGAHLQSHDNRIFRQHKFLSGLTPLQPRRPTRRRAAWLQRTTIKLTIPCSRGPLPRVGCLTYQPTRRRADVAAKFHEL